MRAHAGSTPSAETAPAESPDWPCNLLTIDVEDYFHANGLQVVLESWDSQPGRVEYTTRRLVDLLGREGVTATFFVLGWVASRYPGLVREIHEAGHEIASHGWGHQLVYDQKPAQFRVDVLRAKELLEGLTGERVLGYRAPSFSIVPRSRWALDVLIETGSVRLEHLPYRSRALWLPAGAARHSFARGPRWGRLRDHRGAAIDAATVPSQRTRRRRRLFPGVPAVVHALGSPAPEPDREDAGRRLPAPVEIDPDQPTLPASRGNRFRHYLNLDRTEKRLIAILRTSRFCPVRSLLNLPVVAAPAERIATTQGRIPA